MGMSLADFQLSRGIDVNQQICLINNKVFPGALHVCVGASLPPGCVGVRLSTGEVMSVPRGGGVVFCGRSDRSVDTLDYARLLLSLIQRIDARFSVVVGKGDYEVDGKFAEQIPANVDKVWVNNKNVAHEKIYYLPMGRDFRSQQYHGFFPGESLKETLLYCNFSLDTHPVRRKMYDIVKGLPFATLEHMGNFLAYPIRRDVFYERVAQSRFVLCPRGNAIDTFRLWDCMYLGAIPIVLREAEFHRELVDLPVLFVDGVEELMCLTAESLESRYEQMRVQEFKYQKLRLGYWVPVF